MALNSYDNLLASASTNGLLGPLLFFGRISTNPTIGTTSAGYQRAARVPTVYTVPSLGGGVNGVLFTTIDMTIGNSANGTCIAALEYGLGTCTANGGTGTYASGSSMPTKTVAGTSITTASQMVWAVVTTTMVGAGTYTLTITYVNQAGTGSRTCTISVPNVSNAQSAFLLNPHLQSGDTGMQSITNITLSGTSGVIEIKGCLTLSTAMYSSGSNNQSPDNLTVPQVPWLAVAGDTIGFYVTGVAATTIPLTAILAGVAST